MRNIYGLPTFAEVDTQPVLRDTYSYPIVGLEDGCIGVLHDYALAKFLSGNFFGESWAVQYKLFKNVHEPIVWVHYWRGRKHVAIKPP